MDAILEELGAGLPDARQFARIVIRLLIAMLLGAIVGAQREHTGKPAGIRTHMLVSLGAALFVLAAVESGMTSTEVSRVIQGLATGIGFLGGGAILKLSQEREIRGLTSAAVIWMTAAMGVAVGLGRLWIAMLSMALTWFILTVVEKIERRISAPQSSRDDSHETPGET
ncbi:MAG TPA: MgtC/SapB family protein [Blastocatellia bacterium]|nr:MgtC/SapB family protein [Blastocatellia bacterium]